MNVKEYTTEISARLAMRSFFIYAFAASLIVNVILAFGLIVLDKKDRVVVLPAEITKSFWLDANGVSPEYLEQMGLFALHSLLIILQRPLSTTKESCFSTSRRISAELLKSS